MKNFTPKTVVEQVADAIAEEIRAGKLTGLLPSIRALSKRYQLSVPSVHKARSLLLSRGLLEFRGAKRRLSVVAQSKSSRGAAATVVVFCAENPDHLSASIMLSLQAAAGELIAGGNGCIFEPVFGLSPEKARARIAEALSFHRPTHCVLLYGDKDMLRQLHRYRRARISLIGGNQRLLANVVRLCGRMPLLIEHAVTQLKSLGHRRFFVPCLRRDGSLQESLVEMEAIEVRQEVDLGVSWLRECTCSVELIEQRLDTALAAGVTAVLFAQWGDYISTMSYFRHRRLRIPEDVSVVVLSGGSAGYTCCSVPAHFSLKADYMRQQFLRWVTDQEIDQEWFTQRIIETWTPGGTLAKAASGLGKVP